MLLQLQCGFRIHVMDTEQQCHDLAQGSCIVMCAQDPLAHNVNHRLREPVLRQYIHDLANTHKDVPPDDTGKGASLTRKPDLTSHLTCSEVYTTSGAVGSL
jgi:hypothetical protein